MTEMRAELLEQKAALIAYLTTKIKANDFHAVQDAASDIRELDAKMELLLEIEKAAVHHSSVEDRGYGSSGKVEAQKVSESLR